MALDCGVDAERFWGMSMGEILATVESHGRREKRRQDEALAEARHWAGMLHRHAQLVSVATWNGKKYPRTIEAAFPWLFKADEGEAATVPQWKKQQAGMAAWVAAYNDRVGKKGGAGLVNGSDAGNQG